MKRAATFRSTIALTLGSMAIPAVAEVAPLGSNVARPYQVVSKSEAILGGQPSALASITASQAGASSLANRASLSISPSSPGVPTGYNRIAAPRAIALDRPNVFGSVALAIGSSPLDDRWQRVSRGSAGTDAQSFAARLASHAPLERLDAINRFVNARVQFTNDITLFGVDDRWTAGADTLRRGKGDCEDFAIAKLQMLRHAGFNDADLYLVILRDTRRSADHAVLVVRAEGRMLVLDNGTDRIVDSDTLTDYRPILTYSGKRVWTHGYRRDMPPVTYAAVQNRDAPVVALEVAESDERLQGVTIAAASMPAASLAMPF